MTCLSDTCSSFPGGDAEQVVLLVVVVGGTKPDHVTGGLTSRLTPDLTMREKVES